MVKSLLVFLSLFFVSLGAFAESPRQSVYDKIMKDCRPLKSDYFLIQLFLVENYKPLNLEIFWDSSRQTFAAEALNPDAILSLIENSGMSPKLTQLLSDPEYQAALEECFPEDPFFQRLYTMRWVQTDIQGKAAATIGTYFVGKFMGKGLSAVNAKSPLTHKAVIGAFATWSTYKAYSIIKNISKERSPEQQAEVDRFIIENAKSPEKIIEGARRLLQEEIFRLQEEMKQTDLSEAQIKNIKNKLLLLEKDLKSIS